MRERTQGSRVAFNGRFLTRRQSGVQRVARQLLRSVDGQLAERVPDGQAFEVICPARTDLDDLDLRAMSVRKSGSAPSTLAWEQLQLPLLARDEILVNLCNVAPLLSAGGITMIHDAQTYLSPESYSPAFVAWYHFAAPRIARRAARVLTVSEFSQQMLVRFGVVEPDKVKVLYNGVDHLLEVREDRALIARLGLESGNYILAMASGQAHKNIQVLLKAFEDPSLAATTLVLYGNGGDLPTASARSPNTILAGRVSDAELRSLIENAAVFAFPSTTEGFGLPPMEAMSFGCPAIVAPCGALPEVCGDAALYADPADPAEWVAAIRHLLDNPAARALWSARALARAKLFSWSKSARELLSLIDEVAAGEPAVGPARETWQKQAQP